MRTPLLSLAGAAVLALAGCRTPHEPTHFELAEKAMAAGDTTTALQEYEEAVRLEPQHKYAWLNIGYLKAEKQGGKDYTKMVRDALMTFLMLETYEIGNVECDHEWGICTPEEPHLARRMVRGLNTVVRCIDNIEDQALICFELWREAPEDAELKAFALESQQAALDANMGMSPRAHFYLGEIARLSGEEAAANGHYQQALDQAKSMNRNYRRAQVGLALTGGNMDEGWLAIKEENNPEFYVAYAEKALSAGDVDRAIAALTEARRQHVRLDIYRKLAEAYLLADQTENAKNIIGALEKWPRQNKEVELFLRICAAALSGEKTDAWSKKLDGVTPGGSVFDPARLAAKVEGSAKADDAGKKAVKKGAAKLTGGK